MYQFILNMWKMKRVTESQVLNFILKGYINEDQANTILETPQI